MKRLEQFGMKFVGHDVDGERMEIMELEGIVIFFHMYLGMAKRILKNRTVMPDSFDVREVSLWPRSIISVHSTTPIF